MRAIPEMLGTLYALLPVWVLVPLGVLLLAVAIPSWLYSVRVKQIKNRMRWLAGKRPGPDREALIGELFALAGNDGRKLVAVADEALRVNQRDVFRAALDRLVAGGLAPLDVARLRKEVMPEKQTYKHPLEALVAVNRLVDEGLTAHARERLAEAQARFPHDPDLAALAGRLAEAGEPA